MFVGLEVGKLSNCPNSDEPCDPDTYYVLNRRPGQEDSVRLPVGSSIPASMEQKNEIRLLNGKQAMPSLVVWVVVNLSL